MKMGDAVSILSGSTILIGEPYAATASGLVAIIEQWGGSCRTVRSRAELNAALQSALPDLLLVNIDLVNGIEGIRTLSHTYPTTIIAMAARFLAGNEDFHGKVMCLEMPFSILDLQHAITSMSSQLSESLSVAGVPLPMLNGMLFQAERG